MKKRLLSLAMALILVFSLMPAFTVGASAADNYVYVSVENHSSFTTEAAPAWSGSLFDGGEHNSFSASGAENNCVRVACTAGTTAYEAVLSAMQSSGLSAADAAGSGRYITSSSYGGYISSVNGLSAGDDGGYSGWTYAVFASGKSSGVSPAVGMGSYYVSAGDTIRLLYSNSAWETGAPYTLKSGGGNTATSPTGFGFTKGSISAETSSGYVTGYTLTLLNGATSTTLTKLPDAVSGDTVTVYNASGVSVGSAAVGSDGTFSLPLSDLTDGSSYQIVVDQYKYHYDLKISYITAEQALSDTLKNYYQGSGGLHSDLGGRDWETVNAVYAATVGNGSYFDGAELKYVMPTTPNSQGSKAALTIYSLVKGDIEAAKSYVESIVTGNVVTDPGYSYGLALNMLAAEAYNRAAEATTGYDRIPYGKSAAIPALIGYCSTEFYKNADYLDLDSSALTLMALSQYTDTDYSDVVSAASTLKDWMKTKYAAAKLSDFYSPANTAACILWAISATGDSVSDWSNPALGNPLELLMNYYIKGGGFYYSTAGTVDPGATDQATLALANYAYSHSFHTEVTINPQKNKGSATVYKVESASIDTGTKVSLSSGISVLSDVISSAGISGSYHFYEVGDSKVTKRASAYDTLSDGMVILAVPEAITRLVYFQTDSTTSPGANVASIPFGGSASLTLVSLDLPTTDDVPINVSTAVPVKGASLKVGEDTFTYKSDSTSGGVTISPTASNTKVSYNGTRAADTAYLQAAIRMAQGAVQSKAVSVRIEGPTGNVLYYPSFTVIGDGASVLTAGDAVCQALDYKGYSNGNTYSYSGGYLSSMTINGAEYCYNSDHAGSYWAFAYNDAYSNLGLGSTVLRSGDSIIVYWTNNGSTVVASQTSTTWDISGTYLKASVKGADGAAIGGATVKLSTSPDFSNSFTATADSATGVAEFSSLTTAEAISAGKYYVQIEKNDLNSSPQIVRLTPNATVTFTPGGSSSDTGSGDSQHKDTVAVRVVDPYGHYMYDGTVDWFDGMTAYDTLRSTGLSVTASSTGYGTYIKKIESYGEMDLGANSGWVYAVNCAGYSAMTSADYPTVAASGTPVSAGEYVLWRYTENWTTDTDVSGNEPGSSTEAKTTITPSVAASNGAASVTLSTSDLTDAISEAAKSGGTSIVIAPEITGTAANVTVTLPKSSVSSIVSDAGASLSVQTPVGNVTLPNTVLASITSQASGSTVTVSLEAVGTSSLTTEQRAAAGDNTVYDISILSGERSISSFDGGSITISLPYKLKTGEIADGVMVWYLSGEGKLEKMACTYDAKTGLAAFPTTHLSSYVVGYDVWTNPFTDVKQGAWYYDAVQYAARNGLFNGTSAATFSPDEAMTRAMLVTVLYRMDKSPAVSGPSSFTDVKAGQWYANAVQWAQQNKIVAGYNDTTFGTDDHVSREQMAAILYRYAQYKKYDTAKANDLAAFTDADSISAWALGNMKWAVAEGLVSGTTATTLEPSANASRAQVAAILMRFAQNVMK